jgi:lactose/L-arabinose transport system substrate-binding protein
MRTAGTLGMGALVAGAASACAPGSTGGTKVLASATPSASARGEITLWQNNDDLLKVFRSVIPSYNARYPHVKVNMIGLDVATKLPPALITGSGVPDGSFFADGGVLSQAAHLTDVTDLMTRYRADTVQFKLDVNTVGGRLYGIPWDTDPGLLYYRSDILSAAGVHPAELTSYDALLDAARAIKRKFPKAQPIPLETNPNLGMQWLMMLVSQQQGTGLVDASGKLTIDTDAYRNALTWIKQVADEDLGCRQAFATAADVADLDNGTMSLLPWAIWWIFLLQSALKTSVGKWRVAQLPAWTPGGARSGQMGGSSFVIPAKAKNPQLAWTFYEHLVYSPEGYTKVFGPNPVYPNGLNTALPSVKSALSSPTPLFKPISQMNNQPLWQIDTQAGLAIPPGYRIPTWFDQAANYLGSNLQQLMTGKMSVDEVISKSVSGIQKNLVNR